jgi:hypothetical protein
MMPRPSAPAIQASLAPVLRLGLMATNPQRKSGVTPALCCLASARVSPDPRRRGGIRVRPCPSPAGRVHTGQVPRPALLLDVDGVLNPYGAATCPEGFSAYDLFPSEEPVRLCPAHGDWISELRHVFDVAWATAWNDDANRLLAPLLGITALPVVAMPPPRSSRATRCPRSPGSPSSAPPSGSTTFTPSRPGHGAPLAANHPAHTSRLRRWPDTTSRRSGTHLGKADLINSSLQESRTPSPMHDAKVESVLRATAPRSRRDSRSLAASVA